MSQNPRIPAIDSFDHSYNYTLCKAIKLEKLQPDIKDLCQKDVLDTINIIMNENVKFIVTTNNL